MKTTIKCDDDLYLTISDDDFDVGGWVTLEIQGWKTIDVHMDDLMPAIMAYDYKWQRYREVTEKLT